jgi:hypothetical protein
MAVTRYQMRLSFLMISVAMAALACALITTTEDCGSLAGEWTTSRARTLAFCPPGVLQ